MTLTVSRQKARTMAAPNTQATTAGGKGAMRMPRIASVLTSPTSSTDDAISQEPGRELQRWRRSRET